MGSWTMDVYVYAEFNDGIDISNKFKTAFLLIDLVLLNIDYYWHYRIC